MDGSKVITVQQCLYVSPVIVFLTGFLLVLPVPQAGTATGGQAGLVSCGDTLVYEEGIIATLYFGDLFYDIMVNYV
jgi:hypothetical protein